MDRLQLHLYNVKAIYMHRTEENDAGFFAIAIINKKHLPCDNCSGSE